MVEVDRYQALVQEKERLNEQWDEANAMLMESHEKVREMARFVIYFFSILLRSTLT